MEEMTAWVLVVVTLLTMEDQQIRVYAHLSKKDCEQDLYRLREFPKTLPVPSREHGGIAFCVRGVAWNGYGTHK